MIIVRQVYNLPKASKNLKLANFTLSAFSRQLLVCNRYKYVNKHNLKKFIVACVPYFSKSVYLRFIVMCW